MGSNASQLEKDIGSELFPNEHYFGLVSECFQYTTRQSFVKNIELDEYFFIMNA